MKQVFFREFLLPEGILQLSNTLPGTKGEKEKSFNFVQWYRLIKGENTFFSSSLL